MNATHAERQLIFEISQNCRRFAEQGGKEILGFQGDIRVRSKGARDFVTIVDELVQNKIVSWISAAYPNSQILGEERQGNQSELPFVSKDSFDINLFSSQLGQIPDIKDAQPRLLWIIDPIDGTNNFIHGFPYFGVSIAAAIDGIVVAGAVFDVCRNDCFWAAAGQGVYMNDEVIHVAHCNFMDQAMFVGSVPRHFERYPNANELFTTISSRCQSVRRLGSAALNLCYVACGRLDGYWALSLQIWDVAAGALIVQQAGGFQRVKVDPISGGMQMISVATQPLFTEVSRLVDESQTPNSCPRD